MWDLALRVEQATIDRLRMNPTSIRGEVFIERIFDGLEAWRRIATRADRYAHTSMRASASTRALYSRDACRGSEIRT